MSETLVGGCLCGAIRYRAEAPETLHYLCHCTDCQRYAGGPYHAAIVVAAADLTVEGAPRVYTRQADSGRTIARHFCGECGGHLFTSPWPDATRFSPSARPPWRPTRTGSRRAFGDARTAFEEGQEWTSRIASPS